MEKFIGMSFESISGASDGVRVEEALRQITEHGSLVAITGGLAIELHILQHGGESLVRPFGHDPIGRHELRGVALLNFAASRAASLEKVK